MTDMKKVRDTTSMTKTIAANVMASATAVNALTGTKAMR